MTQLKFYKYGMWLLLLINIIMIAFFLLGPRPPKNSGSHLFMSEAIELLHLDAAQKERFSELAKDHKEKMISLDRQIKNAVAPYFLSVTQDGTVDRDSIQEQMTDLERQKIIETYQHFEDVNQILNPEQKRYFEKFVFRALHIIMEETGPDVPIDSQ